MEVVSIDVYPKFQGADRYTAPPQVLQSMDVTSIQLSVSPFN